MPALEKERIRGLVSAGKVAPLPAEALVETQATWLVHTQLPYAPRSQTKDAGLTEGHVDADRVFWDAPALLLDPAPFRARLERDARTKEGRQRVLKVLERLVKRAEVPPAVTELPALPYPTGDGQIRGLALGRGADAPRMAYLRLAAEAAVQARASLQELEEATLVHERYALLLALLNHAPQLCTADDLFANPVVLLQRFFVAESVRQVLSPSPTLRFSDLLVQHHFEMLCALLHRLSEGPISVEQKAFIVQVSFETARFCLVRDAPGDRARAARHVALFEKHHVVLAKPLTHLVSVTENDVFYLRTIVASLLDAPGLSPADERLGGAATLGQFVRLASGSLEEAVTFLEAHDCVPMDPSASATVRLAELRAWRDNLVPIALRLAAIRAIEAGRASFAAMLETHTAPFCDWLAAGCPMEGAAADWQQFGSAFQSRVALVEPVVRERALRWLSSVILSRARHSEVLKGCFPSLESADLPATEPELTRQRHLALYSVLSEPYVGKALPDAQRLAVANAMLKAAINQGNLGAAKAAAALQAQAQLEAASAIEDGEFAEPAPIVPFSLSGDGVALSPEQTELLNTVVPRLEATVRTLSTLEGDVAQLRAQFIELVRDVEVAFADQKDPAAAPAGFLLCWNTWERLLVCVWTVGWELGLGVFLNSWKGYFDLRMQRFAALAAQPGTTRDTPLLALVQAAPVVAGAEPWSDRVEFYATACPLLNQLTLAGTADDPDFDAARAFVDILLVNVTAGEPLAPERVGAVSQLIEETLPLGLQLVALLSTDKRAAMLLQLVRRARAGRLTLLVSALVAAAVCALARAPQPLLNVLSRLEPVIGLAHNALQRVGASQVLPDAAEPLLARIVAVFHDCVTIYDGQLYPPNAPPEWTALRPAWLGFALGVPLHTLVGSKTDPVRCFARALGALVDTVERMTRGFTDWEAIACEQSAKSDSPELPVLARPDVSSDRTQRLAGPSFAVLADWLLQYLAEHRDLLLRAAAPNRAFHELVVALPLWLAQLTEPVGSPVLVQALKSLVALVAEHQQVNAVLAGLAENPLHQETLSQDANAASPSLTADESAALKSLRTCSPVPAVVSDGSDTVAAASRRALFDAGIRVGDFNWDLCYRYLWDPLLAEECAGFLDAAGAVSAARDGLVAHVSALSPVSESRHKRALFEHFASVAAAAP